MSIRRRLHEDLLKIYRAGIDAVLGQNLMRRHLTLSPDGKLLIKKPSQIGIYPHEMTFDLANRNVYVIGAGKGVLGLCEGFLKLLDSQKSHPFKFKRGQLIVPIGSKYDTGLLKRYNIKVEEAAKHNMPDERAMKATQDMIQFINQIKEENNGDNRPLIVSFITGGASALLNLPSKGITLDKKREIIKRLQINGANIVELNIVRQCLSQVKGGKLAKLASPIEMIVFIVSDIDGDPIHFIGSGPTVPPPVENLGKAAMEIVEKYKIPLDDKTIEVIKAEEGGGSDTGFSNVQNILLANNAVAVHAALMAAQSLGYRTISPNCGAPIDGETKIAGRNFANIAKASNMTPDQPKVCWITGGETTVDMSGGKDDHGVGGRCQHMALTFMVETWDSTKVASAFMAGGTDGQDGPTPVAGAIVLSGQSSSKSPEVLEKAKHALRQHDAYTFLKENFPDSLIDTGGPTGTNVTDIYCLVKALE